MSTENARYLSLLSKWSGRLGAIILLGLQIGYLDGAEKPKQNLPIHIKIGIVAYDRFESRYYEYERIFQEISNAEVKKRRYVFFSLAIGTYGEVLDWYNKALIDVALLTPGPAAGIFTKLDDNGLTRPTFSSRAVGEGGYLATQIFPKVDPDSILAQDDRKNGERLFDYRTAVVVRQDSNIRSFDDVQALWANRKTSGKKLKFLFVDPLSVSGYLLPMYALHAKGISPEDNGSEIEWTRTHSQSIERLLKPSKPDEERIAFVADETANINPKSAETEVKKAKDQLREIKKHLATIDIPDVENGRPLSEFTIPQAVALLNHNLEQSKGKVYRSIIERFLTETSSASTGNFRVDKEWPRKFAEVASWLDKVEHKSETKKNSYLTLKQLIEELHAHHDAFKTDKIRLAVVLSGGGAKCSYQLGALNAIEKTLREDRNTVGESGTEKALNVDLVVGTSGGAINALIYAAGVTHDPRVLDTWKEFSQSSFFQPEPILSRSFGIVFGLLEAIVIIFLTTGFRLEARWKRAVIALIAISLLQLSVALLWLNYSGWGEVIGANHMLFHLSFLITLFCLWTFIVLMAVGVILWVTFVGRLSLWLRWKSSAGLEFLRSRLKFFYAHPRMTKAILLGIVVLLFGVGLWLPFRHIRSISSAGGVEAEFARKLPDLLDFKPADPTAFKAKNDQEKLAEVSRSIIEKNTLQRDLVITASRLSAPEDSGQNENEGLPADLYFFYTNDTGPVDDRFISFTNNPDKLLDVVIGSSSIYPVFPPKKLTGIISNPKKNAEDMEIIDGGFAHNIPIEAAVAWGATHIIVIEASAKEPPSNVSFLDNTAAAFNYLFYQAQQIDTKAKGRVEIFELRPACVSCQTEKQYNEDQSLRISTNTEGFNLDTFDFESPLVDYFNRKGADDALSETPRFRRIRGEPNFRSVGPTP